MKHLLISVLLTYALSCSAQKNKVCDRIYQKVDVEPSYPGGLIGLHRFLNRDLMHAIDDCYAHDSIMIT
jgi:hypothetical protein